MKGRKKDSAFALIEIIIVVFLALLLLSIGSFFIKSFSLEERLEKEAKKLRQAVSFARTKSFKTGESAHIFFKENEIIVLVKSNKKLPKWLDENAVDEEYFTYEFDPFEVEEEEQNEGVREEKKTFKLAEDVKFLFKKAHEKEWREPKADTAFAWSIGHDEINQPINFRFEIAKSFCELSYGAIFANFLEKVTMIE